MKSSENRRRNLETVTLTFLEKTIPILMFTGDLTR